jgi:HAD superfamily PSPase-like hydrolase
MAYRLVAFDLDGTLLAEKSSWWTLHKSFGTYTQSLKNMADYENARITYDEFMRRDIALWKPLPHIDVIKRILLTYTLVPNAKYVVDELKQREYSLVIVTTGLEILAKDVASRLGILDYLANGLVLDSDGHLSGEVIFRVDLFEKQKALDKFIEKRGIRRAECVAVGDSKYDASFLKNVGLGVAFGSDIELRRVAKAVITDLKDLLNFL